VIDRVVGYGVAWHEGHLFGIVNQVIGVCTALMLSALSLTGFILWRRRKPAVTLGAPAPSKLPVRMGGVVTLTLLLSVLLPMLAISLALVLALEFAVLRRLPATARWLGLPVR
jgi:uncharacterized iron-regulated membrane protein